jgi:hypothetical protein
MTMLAKVNKILRGIHRSLTVLVMNENTTLIATDFAFFRTIQKFSVIAHKMALRSFPISISTRFNFLALKQMSALKRASLLRTCKYLSANWTWFWHSNSFPVRISRAVKRFPFTPPIFLRQSMIKALFRTIFRTTIFDSRRWRFEFSPTFKAMNYQATRPFQVWHLHNDIISQIG